MATQIILLERIENLGAMGDIVDVKPGYARNFLLPQRKALRATKDNIAYFESQKAALEKVNNEKKSAAEKHAKDLDGLKVVMIRQAGETGQLYGSVTGRDIADAINDIAKEKIERNMVILNQNIKSIGLIPVEVALHPEVKITVTVNIARTEDEAATQAKTGKAMIADEYAAPAQKAANDSADDMKADLMEADALEAERAAEAEAAEKEAEDAAKAEAKAQARAEKKAAAEAEEENAGSAEAEPKEEASEAQATEMKEEKA